MNEVFFHIHRHLSVIIFKYLFKEIYSTLLMTALVLLLVLIANQFIHYLDNAASGTITFTAVLEIMSLQVPLLLGYILPLGLFLGILLAFGRLCVDHEMTVMSACGISRIQFLNIIIVVTVLLMLVISWLMLWEEPIVQRYRVRILTEAMASATIAKLIPGRFQSFANGRWTFYAKDLDKSADSMQDVFLASQQTKISGKTQWDIVTASKAYEKYFPKQGARFLVFDQGYRSIGVPGQNDYQLIQFSQYGIRLNQTPQKFNNAVEYWSTSKLLRHLSDNKDAAAEFHWRLAMPVSAFILALIALSLSYVHPRSGRFAKFFPAILIYIAYANLLFVGRDWIQEGKVNVYLGLWWVHGVVLVLALVLLGQYLGWWRKTK